MHLISGLKANLLISIDILGLEVICLDFYKSIAKFPHCGNLEAELKITIKENEIINCSVRVSQNMTILTHTAIEILVRITGRKLSGNQDFMY